jgi:hypothetical protein
MASSKYNIMKPNPLEVIDVPKGQTRCGCPVNTNLVSTTGEDSSSTKTIANIDEEELLPGQVSMAPQMETPKLQARNQETLKEMKKKVQSSLNTKQMSSAISRRMKGGKNES